MKTLLVYCSKYGTTEECVRRLENMLAGETTTINLGSAIPQNVDDYNTVIIGGPVYMGRLHKPVREFIKAYTGTLMHKHLGLFLVNGTGSKEEEKIFAECYPPAIVSRAAAKACFGGQLQMDKLSGVDKLVAKAASKTLGGSLPQIDNEAIRSFALLVQKQNSLEE